MNKNIMLLVIGVINSCYALGIYIESFEKVNDGWGISFDFNMNYLIYFITSLLFTIYCIILVKETKEVKEETTN